MRRTWQLPVGRVLFLRSGATDGKTTGPHQGVRFRGWDQKRKAQIPTGLTARKLNEVAVGLTITAQSNRKAVVRLCGFASSKGYRGNPREHVSTIPPANRESVHE
jgi:hypothetical protein